MASTKENAPLRGILNARTTQSLPTRNSTFPKRLFTHAPIPTAPALDDNTTLQLYILRTLRSRQFHPSRCLLRHRRLFTPAYNGSYGCRVDALFHLLPSPRASVVASVEMECVIYRHQFVSYCLGHVESIPGRSNESRTEEV